MFGRKRAKKREALPLDDAVRAVADCPCPEHQEGFATALGAAGQVLLRVMGPVATTDGTLDLAAAGEEIQLATAVAPNGRSFLQAFTDLDAAKAKYPDGSFLAVAPKVALGMCLGNGNEGLLVTAAGPDDPWAALTADGVVRLLRTR